MCIALHEPNEASRSYVTPTSRRPGGTAVAVTRPMEPLRSSFDLPSTIALMSQIPEELLRATRTSSRSLCEVLEELERDDLGEAVTIPVRR